MNLFGTQAKKAEFFYYNYESHKIICEGLEEIKIGKVVQLLK